MENLVPAVVFPPGDYLLAILEERGWSQIDFAEIIGRSTKVVNEIIKAKTSITPTTAKEIAAATDTNPIFWLNLEAAYRLHSDQDQPSPRIVRHARLREKYPVREMVLRKWIDNSADPLVLEGQVKSYFGIKELDESPQLYKHAAKKTGYPSDINGPQLAWLFRVKQIALAVGSKAYSAKALREAIPTLQSLLQSPADIVHVPKILEDCGVRFVIVEHVPSSKIDGVCFWLDAKSPVIGMSLRFDRIDNFWFVLRHEIEHVLQRHGKDEAIVDRNLDTSSVESVVSEEERIANEAAGNFCVPRDQMEDFILRTAPLFSEDRIVNFANRIQVHPGLVVGQLHNRRRTYDKMRKYLVRVREIIAPVAFTDGYGHMCPVQLT